MDINLVTLAAQQVLGHYDFSVYKLDGGAFEVRDLEDELLHLQYQQEIIARAKEMAEEGSLQQANIRNVALGELSVIDGEISGLELAAGVGFAFAIDVGVYWIFFSTPQPDASYVATVQSSGFNVDVTDRQADYFQVTVTDRSTGKPASPATLSIDVKRIR